MNKKELIDHIEMQRRFNSNYSLDDAIRDIDLYLDEEIWHSVKYKMPDEYWNEEIQDYWSGYLPVIKKGKDYLFDVGVAYTWNGKWWNEHGNQCDVIEWLESPILRMRIKTDGNSQKVLIIKNIKKSL